MYDLVKLKAPLWTFKFTVFPPMFQTVDSFPLVFSQRSVVNLLDVVHHVLRQPLLKLFDPILDCVDGTEDQDGLDLFRKVFHHGVDEADGLKRFAQAHAVS